MRDNYPLQIPIRKDLEDILDKLQQKNYWEISNELKYNNHYCRLCFLDFTNTDIIKIFSCKLHIFHLNCLKAYSVSVGDSLQMMAFDLLNNKNKEKLNSMNITCKSVKSIEIKNICNNSNYKQLKSDDKNKNKESELIKNIKKIKDINCKEEYKEKQIKKTIGRKSF